MKLHERARKSTRRAVRIKREVEAEPVYERGTYQPSAGSLTDCKGECGRVTFPSLRDGYCVDCDAKRL
jgi:hypothetical protein